MSINPGTDPLDLASCPMWGDHSSVSSGPSCSRCWLPYSTHLLEPFNSQQPSNRAASQPVQGGKEPPGVERCAGLIESVPRTLGSKHYSSVPPSFRMCTKTRARAPPWPAAPSGGLGRLSPSQLNKSRGLCDAPTVPAGTASSSSCILLVHKLQIPIRIDSTGPTYDDTWKKRGMPIHFGDRVVVAPILQPIRVFEEALSRCVGRW